MQAFYFYHQHLEKVSRSFSFCISELASPSKEWVALSYLLLRVVDTIEDALWQDRYIQQEAFAVFKLFLKNTPSEKQLLEWVALFPEQMILEEKNLLLDLPLLLTDKNQLPSEIKNELIDTMVQMIEGMSYFLSQYNRESRTSVPSLTITNQYCFFVAGIVGNLLSRIFTYVLSGLKWTTILLNQSFHFGFFLQKINLLKDSEADKSLGRCYFSSRESLRASLVINARYAMDYLKRIPIIEGRPYRLFCAWSLFIGLASLKWLDKNWQLQQNFKIKPRETYYIINQVRQLIDDNHALEKLFNSYLPEHNKIMPIESKHSMPSWFHAIYPDDGESINWLELGMIDIS